MGGNWAIIILMGLMVLFGLYNAWKVWSFFQKKAASAGWPATEGRVTERNVTSRASKNGRTYIAEVHYDFMVMGKPYQKKLFLGSKGLDSQARKLVDSVPDKIQVHYNPQKPAEHISDLEKITTFNIVSIVLPLLLAVVLLIVLLL